MTIEITLSDDIRIYIKSIYLYNFAYSIFVFGWMRRGEGWLYINVRKAILPIIWNGWIYVLSVIFLRHKMICERVERLKQCIRREMSFFYPYRLTQYQHIGWIGMHSQWWKIKRTNKRWDVRLVKRHALYHFSDDKSLFRQECGNKTRPQFRFFCHHTHAGSILVSLYQQSLASPAFWQNDNRVAAQKWGRTQNSWLYW